MEQRLESKIGPSIKHTLPNFIAAISCQCVDENGELHNSICIERDKYVQTFRPGNFLQLVENGNYVYITFPTPSGSANNVAVICLLDTDEQIVGYDYYNTFAPITNDGQAASILSHAKAFEKVRGVTAYNEEPVRIVNFCAKIDDDPNHDQNFCVIIKNGYVNKLYTNAKMIKAPANGENGAREYILELYDRYRDGKVFADRYKYNVLTTQTDGKIQDEI